MVILLVVIHINRQYSLRSKSFRCTMICDQIQKFNLTQTLHSDILSYRTAHYKLQQSGWL